MKKTLFFAAAAALSILASCQKEEVAVQSNAKPIVFTASIEAPADTKVSVSMTDGKVSWVQGDTIVISNGSVSKKYTADKAGASSTFTVAAGTDPFTEAAQYSATYGTMPAAGVDQAYSSTPGTLIYMVAPQTEKTSSPNFTFTAQCGLLDLNLTDEDKSIKRIYVSDGTNTYKLLCSEAISIASGENFYIALPSGITITKYIIRDSDGYEAVKTVKSGKTGTVIAANQIDKVTFSNLSFSDPVYPESGSAGIKISGTWWAPVNCGYNSTAYPYGKLYQWGRKDGCGYNDGETTEDLIQELYTVNTQVNGTTVTEDATKFYWGNLDRGDWLATKDDNRWGADSYPYNKTEYDPCPAGWRVPDFFEWSDLFADNDGDTIGSDEFEDGVYFNGKEGICSPSAEGNKVFFPAAGYREYRKVDEDEEPVEGAWCRSYEGCYWTSSFDNDPDHPTDGAWCMDFYYEESVFSDVHMHTADRAYGYSVRCVQE